MLWTSWSSINCQCQIVPYRHFHLYLSNQPCMWIYRHKYLHVLNSQFRILMLWTIWKVIYITLPLFLPTVLNFQRKHTCYATVALPVGQMSSGIVHISFLLLTLHSTILFSLLSHIYTRGWQLTWHEHFTLQHRLVIIRDNNWKRS